jgi:hypothetical protein
MPLCRVCNDLCWNGGDEMTTLRPVASLTIYTRFSHMKQTAKEGCHVCQIIIEGYERLLTTEKDHAIQLFGGDGPGGMELRGMQGSYDISVQPGKSG